MKSINLGGSGLMGSAIGLGCMRISSMGREELSRHIHTALDCGITFFDHADIYGGGESERLFGSVLASEPGLRDQLVLQSKCGIRPNMLDLSKEHILESVDGILQRLGTDRLDMLLLHRPDVLIERDQVAEAFERLEQSGKVLHFGVSNFTSRQIELLQSGLKQKLLVNQMQFGIMCPGLVAHGLEANTQMPHAADRDGEVLDYCRLKEITIQAWSPFQYGFFGGTFLDNDQFPELNQTLQEVGDTYGVSKGAVAAAWILRHPADIQVILGTTKPERVREIAAGSEITLSREEWYRIYLAAGNKIP
mgnify:FL=1